MLLVWRMSWAIDKYERRWCNVIEIEQDLKMQNIFPKVGTS